jgi:DNA-binding response OmpR family regulator
VTERSLRILVVEDEMMIAFFIEDCLADLGHQIVGPASRVAAALDLAETEILDLALLDINVAGEQVYPVARQLRARGIPFAFLSGYSARGVSDEWAGTPILSKPFVPEGLKAQIGALMQGGAAGSVN